MFTLQAAEYFDGKAFTLLTLEFVTSLVHGEDFVSRLSRRALDCLKSRVNIELQNCIQHKRQVLMSSISNRFYRKHRKLRPMREMGRKLNPRKFAKSKHSAADLPTHKEECIQIEGSETIDLYIPGRILYVEKCRIFEDSSDSLSIYGKRHSLSLSPRLMPWNKDDSVLPNDTPFHAHASTVEGMYLF